MNYDFLTLEDYNTILLNYRDVFYQEFIVDFSTFDLSMGESVVIDDWVEVTRSIDYYSVVVENSLFTGAFSVTGATEDTMQRQYDKDGYLRLMLTNVSDDTCIRLQLCDLQFNNHDYSDVRSSLWQVTPLPAFVVYPYKQTLSFYVTDSNGEPVNGYVEEVGGNSSDIIDGECSITVNAKNKDRLLLCFGDDDHIHCYVPIHCLNNVVGLTFIDPLCDVLYRSTMAEVGFYHKPLNNPEYKLYYNNRLLASSTGGVDSDHIVFTDIDARALTDGDNIDLTFDINGNKETFNVPVETMNGNWEYLSEVHRNVDVFNLTEDELVGAIFLARGNATGLLQVYNKVGELRNLPEVNIRSESKIEFNDFIFKDITMDFSQLDIQGESVITFNNAVFENINMVNILFYSSSNSLLRFNNCTFKNCMASTFFMGQVEFNYCTFIQTTHNNRVFFDRYSSYTFNKCSFTYDYTIDKYMNNWSILDITDGTVNGESYINANFFINNTSSINIRFRDKYVTGTNGFIYKKNGLTYTYNLNVEDIV